MNEYIIWYSYLDRSKPVTQTEISSSIIKADELDVDYNGNIKLSIKGEVIFFGNSKNISVFKNKKIEL